MNPPCVTGRHYFWEQYIRKSLYYEVLTGVVLKFCENKQRNKALFWKNKALFRIKIFVYFIFIFQNVLLNHFYCMLFSSWVLVFPLTSVL